MEDKFEYVEKREIVTITTSHIVKLMGVEFDLEDLFDLLCSLRGTDVFFNAVILNISDEKIKALENANIVVSSIRGGVGEGSELKKMLDELEKMYDKYVE